MLIKAPGILHVVHSLTHGGTERMLITILRALAGDDQKHSVVTLRQPGALAAQLPDSVACWALRAPHRSYFQGVRLARITRILNAGVIHARNPGCWFDALGAAALTPRTRLILSFHGLESANPFTRRQRSLARLGLALGARFVSVSHSGLRQLKEEAGIPLSRITVLPNGVDLRRFTKSDPTVRSVTRHGLGIAKGDFVVGIVGSLVPVKQHELLIRALSRARPSMQGLKALIVGEGLLRNRLKRLAEDEGVADQVLFTGHCEDVPGIMAAMDAYVCCSESEGMNNALLEAMASGLPAVATDVGDNARVLRHEVDGIIVAPQNAAALADAWRRLAFDPALRSRFSLSARIRVQEYDLAGSLAGYRRLYEESALKHSNRTSERQTRAALRAAVSWLNVRNRLGKKGTQVPSPVGPGGVKPGPGRFHQ